MGNVIWMAVYYDTKCKYCGHNIIKADILDSYFSDKDILDFSDKFYYHVKAKYAVIINDKMCDAIYYGIKCIEKRCECSNPQPRVS